MQPIYKALKKHVYLCTIQCTHGTNCVKKSDAPNKTVLPHLQCLSERSQSQELQLLLWPAIFVQVTPGKEFCNSLM